MCQRDGGGEIGEMCVCVRERENTWKNVLLGVLVPNKKASHQAKVVFCIPLFVEPVGNLWEYVCLRMCRSLFRARHGEYNNTHMTQDISVFRSK